MLLAFEAIGADHQGHDELTLGADMLLDLGIGLFLVKCGLIELKLKNCRELYC
jgi:hypothetical protein